MNSDQLKIHDQMLRQGVQPHEAEILSDELFRADQEFRKRVGRR